jgi:EAL domain-containing protein (putative c-di-GMP-specific phosphodiesterase class I)/ActR/RegA family two-component response regulator
VQNILVVDDEEAVRRLLRDCLELDGYEVREAADALQAIDRIGEAIPDCVLLDVMMPGMSGLELLERLRTDPLTAELPVMMLTAATDDDTTWTGWANGASCYVPKPFDIDHMLDWVGRLCAPAAEPVDPDVFNIDDFDIDSLAIEFPSAAVPAEPAEWFSDPITPPTSSSRPHSEPRTAHPDVALRRSEPVALSSDWAALTQEPLAELSAIANPAAPAAPAASAGPIAPAGPAASAAPAAAAAPEWSASYDGPQAEELVRALDSGQFWVAYQPIIALGTEEITGVEALARWSHPQRGDLAPQEFLALAERHGLAGRLDDVIFHESVKQVSAWNAARTAAGRKPLSLAINVSPDRLAHPDFCETLAETLELNRMSPTAIVLELGEVALMRLFAGDQKVVRGLLEMGVKLAFDDFSAAATSLDYLQRFQVDIVKVDRSLVRRLGLDDNRGDDSTVAAIISIAHRLGRAVVAEGVETAEQAAHLSRLGCEYAQGFHFGFPASAVHLGRRILTDTT